MLRKSTITTNQDAAGKYETEVFEVEEPKSVIICSHGNGVRRWDGEEFFYGIAEHFKTSVVMLVDQNQLYGDGCQLNDLNIMADRVQGLIKNSKQNYPNTPIIVIGHSMGCGVITELDLEGVSKVIFVAPTAGNEKAKLIERYGDEVLGGMKTTSSDGLIKMLPKSYIDSIINITWEDEYKKLLDRYKSVYVFEAGKEELVSEERFKHRQMPFASYKIIEGARHNFVGEPLNKLFIELDALI